MAVLTPKSDHPEILSYREDLRRKFAPGKHEQRPDMNPVISGILEMVGYKVQIITFSQIFHDSYTYVSGQLCKMPKSFNDQRYKRGIYGALEHSINHFPL